MRQMILLSLGACALIAGVYWLTDFGREARALYELLP